jgi:predicted RecA/RadA family phage recombinase
MANNYLQEGDAVEVTAPADVASGAGVLVGDLFGIALNTAVSGAPVTIRRVGVFSINKKSTDVVTQGLELFWDNSAKEITITAGSLLRVGVARDAAGSGVLVVAVILEGRAKA